MYIELFITVSRSEGGFFLVLSGEVCYRGNNRKINRSICNNIRE